MSDQTQNGQDTQQQTQYFYTITGDVKTVDGKSVGEPALKQTTTAAETTTTTTTTSSESATLQPQVSSDGKPTTHAATGASDGQVLAVSDSVIVDQSTVTTEEGASAGPSAYQKTTYWSSGTSGQDTESAQQQQEEEDLIQAKVKERQAQDAQFESSGAGGTAAASSGPTAPKSES